jgi:hypothetical protein
MTIPKIMLSLVVTALLAGPSLAADQTILGKTFLVKDPKPGDVSKRLISTVAKEKGSPNTIEGDPTIIGATLTLIANGGDSSSQAFLLPQGFNVKGKPFWQPTKTGYKYGDAKGEQGPVKAAQISLATSGNFLFKAKLVGKLGPIDVVPPNPGVSAYAVFEIAGGDRYCVEFADGEIKNNGARLFKVSNPTTEGCPSGGSPSGAFLD